MASEDEIYIMKHIYPSLWSQHDNYSRDNGATDVESYHFLLKQKAQRQHEMSMSDPHCSYGHSCSSGGEHTQVRCHSMDTSKLILVKHRFAVAKFENKTILQ
jgi:hypothetical protein